MDERNELEQEVRNLQSELTAETSPCGDWKLMKQLEFVNAGLEAPYTTKEMAEYHKEREEKRKRINEIQKKLEEIVDK